MRLKQLRTSPPFGPESEFSLPLFFLYTRIPVPLLPSLPFRWHYETEEGIMQGHFFFFFQTGGDRIFSSFPPFPSPPFFPPPPRQWFPVECPTDPALFLLFLFPPRTFCGSFLLPMEKTGIFYENGENLLFFHNTGRGIGSPEWVAQRIFLPPSSSEGIEARDDADAGFFLCSSIYSFLPFFFLFFPCSLMVGINWRSSPFFPSDDGGDAAVFFFFFRGKKWKGKGDLC